MCNLLSYWYGIFFGSFLSAYLILYLFTEICLFIQFMRFSPQTYWSGLPFPSPVYHVLSELSTMICRSWVALQGGLIIHWVTQAPLSQEGSDLWRKSPSQTIRKRGCRGWVGSVASLMQWTWTRSSFVRWWGTGRPGMLQSMGLQRVGHDWVTEQQQTDLTLYKAEF